MDALAKTEVTDEPPLERLHNLDAQFLYMEDDDSPMHIGCVCVFEGPVPSREDVFQLFNAKLGLVPRYRKRVRFMPLDVDRPVWADDPHFDLAYHVRRTAIPAPHDDAALCALAGRIMSQRLDRERPLWEAWIVEGLANDRWAFISKVHHAMVDGVSGMELLATILDKQRDAPLPAIQPWTPSPEPSGLALARHVVQGARDDYLSLQRLMADAYLDPVGSLRRASKRAAGMLELAKGLARTSSGPMQGKLSRHRHYAHAAVKLADAQLVRRVFGGPLNDVVLTAVSGGYRALLTHRGADPDHAVLRSMVPVSVRAPDARGILDNRVSVVLCDLAVRIADPLRRLHAISAEMSRLKESHMIEAAAWLNTLSDFIPSPTMAHAARFIARTTHARPQRAWATVTTNVPGPRQSLYMLGHKLIHWYPYVPIAQGIRVGTAILSYDDELAFGVTADYDTVPDVQIVTEGIERTMSQLVVAATACASAAQAGEQQPGAARREVAVGSQTPLAHHPS